MRLALVIGCLMLASGCVLHTRSPSPHPPPPPHRPVAMTYREAVNLGFNQCRSRGYECRLKDADRKGRDVWRVKFHASTRRAKGHLHLDFDAYSRSLLRVDDKVKARRHDWDDDDRRGRGRGKKKGHARRDD
ncbi:MULTISPECIES: hypothetical protein [Myxococcus]|nr:MULTISPECIES: hypothetical protein [Myxococcus]UYI13696.1 hypothetical protein N3T43_32310 [Myxococcus xanthus]UYI21062.1 hypothetical protein N1129_32765 [Myxococcus xanthus]